MLEKNFAEVELSSIVSLVEFNRLLIELESFDKLFVNMLDLSKNEVEVTLQVFGISSVVRVLFDDLFRTSVDFKD